MSARASYSRSMGFGVMSFVSLAVVSVVSSVVVARIYGIRTLGEFALVQATVNAVTFLSSARERPALVRELAKLAPRDPRVTGLFVPVLGFSTTLTAFVAGLVLVVAWQVLDGPVGQPELVTPAIVAVLGFLCFENLNANLDGLLTSFRAGNELFWIRLGQAIFLVGLSIGLGLSNPDLWDLVVAMIATSAVGVAARMAIVRRYMRLRVPATELRRGARQLPDIVRFGLRIAPGGLADGVSNEAGTWTLGLTSSLVAVGAYSRAWLMARQLMYLNVRVTEMLFPTLVERRHTGDVVGFERALVDSLRYAAAGLFALPAVAGGAAAGIMALFGPGFGAASDALAALLCVPALLTLTQIQRHALYAFGRPLLGSVSAGLRLAVTIGATIPLVDAWGPTGAATAMVGGLVADLAFSSARVSTRLSSPLRRQIGLRGLIALLTASGLAFVTGRVVYDQLPNVGGLVLAMAASAVVYAVLLVLGAGLRDEDRARWRSLRAAVRRSGLPTTSNIIP